MLSALLAQTATGNQSAFSAFYDLTSRQIYGLVHRVVVNADLAEDITQDTYAMVWLEAGKFDPTAGSPQAWLRTIAHRRAVDKVRNEQALINRELRWGRPDERYDHDIVGDTVAGQLDQEHLIRQLQELAPLQREAITLAYFDSLTYREVAERLSVPVPTVKSRIRDGLKQLRTRLNREDADRLCSHQTTERRSRTRLTAADQYH